MHRWARQSLAAHLHSTPNTPHLIIVKHLPRLLHFVISLACHLHYKVLVAVERAPSILKGLLYKHEGLNLDSQHPRKMPCTEVRAYNPSTGEVGVRESLGLLDNQSV